MLYIIGGENMSLKFNPFTGNLDFIGDKSQDNWSCITDTIAASSTGVVDSVANTSFEALKYIVSVYNSANSAYKTFEFNVLNNGGSYKDTLTNKLKSGLDVSVNTVNNSGTFELQITNSESFILNVKLAKLILI